MLLVVGSQFLAARTVCVHMASGDLAEPWSIVWVWKLLSIDAGQKMGTQCEIEVLNFDMNTK